MGEKLAFSIEEIIESGPAGRTTIFQEIRDGRLKAKKLGRRTIILRKDYIEWLERLPDRVAVPQVSDETCHGDSTNGGIND